MIQQARRVGLSLALLSGVASAQNFSFPDFASTSGITLNSSATQSGSALRLTPSLGNQAGSAFWNMPVDVQGGFSTTFTFSIAASGGGADGFTFLLHNDPRGIGAIGGAGSGLGYALQIQGGADVPIANSLVVEFDTWNSTHYLDGGENTVSIHSAGTGPNDADESASIRGTIPTTNLSSGAVHTVRIEYDNPGLKVYLNDLTNPILNVGYSLATGGFLQAGGSVGGLNLLPGGKAYVGFSASTGGVTETHDILSWDWVSGLGSGNFCTANNNSTGSPAQMSIGGTSSVGANNLTVFAAPVPTSQFGLFFYGPNQAQIPFGNGFRCVVQGPIGIFRMPIQTSTVVGVLSQAMDFNNPPAPAGQITAGSTWNFQCWFRDPAAGGSNFNLSDGYQVAFTL